MIAYILTPITETDGLPDGYYSVVFKNSSIPGVCGFTRNKWLKDGITHYLRPVTDVVVLNRSQVEKIFEAGHNFGVDSEKTHWASKVKTPDKQTTIDNLFNKQQ